MMATPVVCQECELLWREFAHATAKYAMLSLEQHEESDGGNREQLDADIAWAASERQRVRRLIHEHREAAHPGEPEAGADLFAA